MLSIPALSRSLAAVPLVIGGIEASLRRTTHYDYWSKRLRRSIPWMQKADILVNGTAKDHRESRIGLPQETGWCDE